MCSRWLDDKDLQIIELAQTRLVLNRDQFFPGYCLLFSKVHATEPFHLSNDDFHTMMSEVRLVAKALYNLYRPTKMNYELLGNMVPHIHWHLVPRFDSDPLWPKPIWSEPHTESHLADDDYSKRCSEIRDAILRELECSTP